jgi:periplasmic protein TonB
VNGVRLPFALSLLGHAVLLALLALFVRAAPPLPLPPEAGAIAVSLAPSLPQPETPPAPPEPPQPPPQPPPPVAAVVPPPPLPPPPPAVAPPEEPLVPPEKPAVPPLRPVVRRPARVERYRPAMVPMPAAPSPSQPQTASARLPAPPTAVSPGYRALLGAWLEEHKRYPENARERGEEGRAVLQFAVDRSGRVLDFSLLQSTGYADLDEALDRMMRGATLPSFPPDMPQSSIRVTVAIRFSLER